jgi:Flp pilus assembly protein TadD
MRKGLTSDKRFLVACGLVIGTMILYWQTASHDFVNYDDDKYVVRNPQVQAGLTKESFLWAFTTGHASNWHPLTWLSHMLDVQLFGLNPKGHHLVNVFFHVLNTVLLFLVLNRLTNAVWRSGFIAALFAFHPLHVESVAWIAERKDVLSTFFWMLTLWAYLLYVEKRGLGRYLIVFLLLALGLMAKPMLVTLPFVLLLLDYWPLKRMRFGKAAATETKKPSRALEPKMQRTDFFSLLLEKLPLFLPVAASSVVTYLVQKRWESLPFMDRVSNAIVSYVKYLSMMIWPSDLAVLYLHPVGQIPLWKVIGAAVILVGISYLLIYVARRWRFLAVGWLWYLGTLVPVIGIVQVGSQAMADRYTYVPLIGLFIVVAWGVPELLSKWRHRRIALSAAGVLVLLLCGTLTWSQIRHWKDSVTLWEHATQVTENNWVAHTNLGAVLSDQGRIDEAVAHYQEVIRIDPLSPSARFNLAAALAKGDRIDEALKLYNEAVEMRPDYPEAHNNLGNILADQGKIDEAIVHYTEAIRFNPNYSEAYNNLGLALLTKGKIDEAIQNFSAALRLNPNSPAAHFNIGLALERKGSLSEAIIHYGEALRLKPNDQLIRRYFERASSMEEKEREASPAQRP